MKLKNAIVQLEKHIGPVNATPHGELTKYRAVPPGGRTGIEFLVTKSSDEIVNLRVAERGEDNHRTECRSGWWCKNMKQMIEYVRGRHWPSDAREA